MEDGLKISELNTTTTINSEDLIPIVQNGETKSIAYEDFNKYSTTEQVIGTWIDGKPIYRKVIFTNTATTGGEVSIDTGISNLGEFTSLSGILTRSTGSSLPIPRSHTSSFDYQIGLYYAPVNNTMRVEIGSSVTNVSKITIIMEYTKTTD